MVLVPCDADYFQPSEPPFMINYRVDDLDGVLAMLSAAGVKPVGCVESCSYGRFGWILDPDGRKIELWEPVDEPGAP